mmetsp:Transcript_15664/g.43381  ORF Transcript_15664/g.43381 Transcript_15664/m.43381 type:complete len:662 (+) Transcript_15664:201-2186(+)|eukprot:CAMPEP_0172363874 /NCGR_PEP_ID=MMETSP1060-20121228/7112_1 /TAXON_ID=37318 /ORGANISM="Pseudo-nitzschia pungens, Strain cf. cingulata" /LENGTH=661 /DNA_ID=CAMNT_0013086725 /DNA_START=165 /DNA_END=2150 /DNA_ORIENTATION=+
MKTTVSTPNWATFLFVAAVLRLSRTPSDGKLRDCFCADAFKETRTPFLSQQRFSSSSSSSTSLLLLNGKPRKQYHAGRNPLFVSGGDRSINLKAADGDSEQQPSPPLSQVESIRSLAKSLNFFGKKKITDNTNETTETGTANAKQQQRQVYVKSVAAGLAVSLAMIPEAISFSYVAGVSPLVGLWTTVLLGFVAATFGGRPGICSSASGACSVVVAPLCAAMGAPYLSVCALVAGILQIAFRSTGKFIRLVPHPVMLGFVNGLTVVMARAQLGHFRDASGAFLSLSSAAGRSMIGLTALTAALVRFIPRISALKSVPPTLGAVMFCSILQKLLKLPGVKTLADVSGAETFRGGWSVLPRFELWPSSVPFSLETLNVVLPYAITMAAVGAIESLLTMQLIDNMMEDGTSSTKQECVGQGLGNIAAGLTGGIGGCALLGQSIINVQSGGGLSRLSGMSVSLFLAMGILVGAPLLANVPIAALVGVMLTVCQSTFSWSSLRIMHKIPRLDAFVIFLVSFVTVRDDLAKAVVAGIVASALGFAWKQSTEITATATEGKNKKSYRLKGPLFFGSVTSFSKLFSNVRDDPSEVVIDFSDSRVYDHSALEAIHNVADKYNEAGKKVQLRHLSNDCSRLLSRLHGDGSSYQLVIEADPKTDPVYSVATN